MQALASSLRPAPDRDAPNRAPMRRRKPSVPKARARPAQARKEAPPIEDDGRTAIYDITARTVYLPSGRRLEAHSGFGGIMDNPRHVHVRMRGATPPNVYNLTLREQLFHGVRAIRLNPVDRQQDVRPRRHSCPHLHAGRERPVERMRVLQQLSTSS